MKEPAFCFFFCRVLFSLYSTTVGLLPYVRSAFLVSLLYVIGEYDRCLHRR